MDSTPPRPLRTGFLVELYVGAVLPSEVLAACAPAHRAADGWSTPVRYLRSIVVPTDETCFHLFEAGSAGAVEAALGMAAIRHDRISRAWLVEADEVPRVLRIPDTQENAR